MAPPAQNRGPRQAGQPRGRVKRTKRPLDELERFCVSFLEKMTVLGAVPFEGAVSKIENVTGILLYRSGQFQVQMFAVPEGTIIPEHTHPNVDSIEVYMGGNIHFSHSGKYSYDGAFLIPDGGPLGLAKKRGNLIRVRPNDIHGGVFGKGGGVFLSVQHWLNGVTPHCVAADYDGITMASTIWRMSSTARRGPRRSSAPRMPRTSNTNRGTRATARQPQSDWPAERRAMVERQLRARGIHDVAVLNAFLEVPREAFVNEDVAHLAYGDHPLPIEARQTISQPYIVALMIEAADIRADQRVLEIGSGSGYAAAVMSRIAGRVVGVERHRELADLSRERLARLGCSNIEIVEGDGTLGWPDEAPYDAILVAASGSDVPPSLVDQLAPGGRLVMPIGAPGDVQRLILVTKDGKGRSTAVTLARCASCH